LEWTIQQTIITRIALLYVVSAARGKGQSMFFYSRISSVSVALIMSCIPHSEEGIREYAEITVTRAKVGSEAHARAKGRDRSRAVAAFRDPSSRQGSSGAVPSCEKST
jgi:hypothetical protein